MKIYGLSFSIWTFSIYYIDPTPPDLTHEISDLAYLALIFKTDSDIIKSLFWSKFLMMKNMIPIFLLPLSYEIELEDLKVLLTDHILLEPENQFVS